MYFHYDSNDIRCLSFILQIEYGKFIDHIVICKRFLPGSCCFGGRGFQEIKDKQTAVEFLTNFFDIFLSLPNYKVITKPLQKLRAN